MLNTLTKEYTSTGDRYCTGGFVSDTCSVRYILAALSYRILHEHSLSRYPKDVPRLRRYMGASLSQVPSIPASPRWFSDFDMYTMQRDWDYWRAFLAWREKIAYEGLEERFEVGDTFRLESHGFEKRNIMFTPSSHRKLPLSQATFDSVNANRRPRDETTDGLLKENDTLSFTVTKVVRVGMEEWSQVVFGRLSGHDKDLCLKILDERQFPFPERHEDQFREASGVPECCRLPSLVFSEDLVNREAAVYRRLPELQGSLLPHCYGFHLVCFDSYNVSTREILTLPYLQVTLPSGWQAYGVLLELIDAPTLYQLFASQALSLEDYKGLVRYYPPPCSSRYFDTNLSMLSSLTSNTACPRLATPRSHKQTATPTTSCVLWTRLANGLLCLSILRSPTFIWAMRRASGRSTIPKV